MGSESAPAALVSVDEAKALLRVAGSEEDALIAGMIRSATDLCEAFCGRLWIARPVTELLDGSGFGAPGWRRLDAFPVRSIGGVERVLADGGTEPLPVESYAVDVDASGAGWVRIGLPEGGQIRVTLSAGEAADWNGVPEAVRAGIVRLAAHLYTFRDAASDPGPPAAVSALWRPWRRLQIGGA